MKENKRKIRRSIYIGISIIAAFIIFTIVYLIITVPTPEEDIYFQMHDYWAEEPITVMYKYDAETQTVSEIGRVSGYFHNAEIDSEKKYITGVRSAYFSYKETSDDDFGIVRFSLEDGTSEFLVTAEQIHSLREGDIHWDYTFPFDNGKQICIDYKSECILYNIETKTSKKIFRSDYGHIYAINGSDVWYYVNDRSDRIERYNMDTEKLNIIAKGVYNFTTSYDGEKVALFSNKYKDERIYLYDVISKKEKCILMAGWNCSFQWDGLQSSGWDKGGKYYYIERFHLLFSDSHKMIKVYDLQTKRAKCIYVHRNAAGTDYEFIRVAN